MHVPFLAEILALVLAAGPIATRAPESEAPARPAPAGWLMIVGGGGTTDPMLARAVELAGGPRSRAVIFSQASSVATSGPSNAKMWLEAGAGDAQAIDLADLPAARALVAQATLVWFSGGDQSRLTKALEGTDLAALVLERYRGGAVVGGTSAGAAVMSRVMITGDYAGGLESDKALGLLRPEVVLTSEGFGFLPETIVDQHFVKRQRFNRLLAAVIERPDLVGIGIDERTAILVHGGGFEVLGESNVLVVDARASVLPAKEPGAPLAAQGIALSVLRPGMKHDLSPPRTR